MSTPPAWPDSDIHTAQPYYQGWVMFTRFARVGIISIVALLVVLAVTLV